MKTKLLFEPDCAKRCGVPVSVLREHRAAGHVKPARYKLIPWRKNIKRLVPMYDGAVVAAFLESVQAHQENSRLKWRDREAAKELVSALAQPAWRPLR